MSNEQLWAAIYGLYKLLEEKVNDEDSYQRLFETNPVIFSVLGLNAVESFEQRSPHALPRVRDRRYKPKPDFIGAELPAGNVVIIELKTPFVGRITKSKKGGVRAQFKDLASQYIQQVSEYVSYINQNSEPRDTLKSVLGVDRIGSYRSVLIYGRGTDNDVTLVSTLAAERRIEILFYDELLERLLDAYARARKDVYRRSGWCYVAYLSFPPAQLHEKAYIAEYGAAGADRIAFYIENESLFYECAGTHGVYHLLQAPIDGEGPHYIRFEFSNDESGLYMSFNVNNVEVETRAGKTSLNFFPDTGLITIGARTDGAQGAHFRLFYSEEHIGTLNLRDKLGSFFAFDSKDVINQPCMEFRPESFMVSRKLHDLQTGGSLPTNL